MAAYWIALRIEESQSSAARWTLLRLAVCLLFLILFFLKFIDSLFFPLNRLIQDLFPLSQSTATKFLLPLGISYYTFKLASYVLDIYWERMKPERDFTAFACSITFFPEIFSGPIHRPIDFLPQIKKWGRFDPEPIVSGLRLILFGFFKKIAVADVLRFHVDCLYGHFIDHTGTPGLLTTYLIPVQIYADFSGVIDIARGSALLFGIHSPINFDRPFSSLNIQEFWRRWNITLTTWLSDYLFTPLRMRFRNLGNLGLYISLMINMIAIGLWHGVRWNYLIFGLIHAFYMILSTLTLKSRNKFSKKYSWLNLIRKITGPIFVFHMFLFSLIIFRADHYSDVVFILKNILDGIQEILSLIRTHQFYAESIMNGFKFNPIELLRICIAISIMALIHWFQYYEFPKMAFSKLPFLARLCVYCLFVFLILILGNYDNLNFIYAGF